MNVFTYVCVFSIYKCVCKYVSVYVYTHIHAVHMYMHEYMWKHTCLFIHTEGHVLQGCMCERALSLSCLSDRGKKALR